MIVRADSAETAFAFEVYLRDCKRNHSHDSLEDAVRHAWHRMNGADDE